DGALRAGRQHDALRGDRVVDVDLRLLAVAARFLARAAGGVAVDPPRGALGDDVAVGERLVVLGDDLRAVGGVLHHARGIHARGEHGAHRGAHLVGEVLGPAAPGVGLVAGVGGEELEVEVHGAVAVVARVGGHGERGG